MPRGGINTSGKLKRKQCEVVSWTYPDFAARLQVGCTADMAIDAATTRENAPQTSTLRPANRCSQTIHPFLMHLKFYRLGGGAQATHRGLVRQEGRPTNSVIISTNSGTISSSAPPGQVSTPRQGCGSVLLQLVFISYDIKSTIQRGTQMSSQGGVTTAVVLWKSDRILTSQRLCNVIGPQLSRVLTRNVMQNFVSCEFALIARAGFATECSHARGSERSRRNGIEQCRATLISTTVMCHLRFVPQLHNTVM